VYEKFEQEQLTFAAVKTQHNERDYIVLDEYLFSSEIYQLLVA